MGNAALTTALVGVIIVMSKVIEYFIKKHLQKTTTQPKATLHPELVRQIRETYESVVSVRKDVDEIRNDNDRHLEIIRDIAECIKTVSESQAKTAELLNRVDRRMEVEEALRLQRLLEDNGK